MDSEQLRETDEEVYLSSSVMTEEEREEILQELGKVCVKLFQRVTVVMAGWYVSASVSVSSWKRRSAR